MYTAYSNYVNLQHHNTASAVYTNYVNLQNNNHEQQLHTKMLATSPAENMSGAHLIHREVGDNEQQIHTKMLEQGTLHKCAMLRYNGTRHSSAKLEQLKTL
jgi:hypothetical protein